MRNFNWIENERWWTHSPIMYIKLRSSTNQSINQWIVKYSFGQVVDIQRRSSPGALQELVRNSNEVRMLMTKSYSRNSTVSDMSLRKLPFIEFCRYCPNICFCHQSLHTVNQPANFKIVWSLRSLKVNRFVRWSDSFRFSINKENIVPVRFFFQFCSPKIYIFSDRLIYMELVAPTIHV